MLREEKFLEKKYENLLIENFLMEKLAAKL
jgi:hypothetical protein